MQTISTIGLDIAKSVFQVHGVDAVGQVVVRRQLKRRHVLAFFQKLLCQNQWDQAPALARGAGVKKTLANPEPSTHGPTRTTQPVRSCATYEDRADIRYSVPSIYEYAAGGFAERNTEHRHAI